MFCRSSFSLLSSVGHCVVCPSIYGPCGIFNLFYMLCYFLFWLRYFVFFLTKYKAVVSSSRTWMVLLMFIVNHSSEIWQQYRHERKDESFDSYNEHIGDNTVMWYVSRNHNTNLRHWCYPCFCCQVQGPYIWSSRSPATSEMTNAEVKY